MWFNNATANWIGVGFGTAALGGRSYEIVTMALEEGFRRFDTAEADYWYDQANVGRALRDYFQKFDFEDSVNVDDECLDGTGHVCGSTTNSGSWTSLGPCHAADLRVTTKIPPWSLTSEEDIRNHAKTSRQELVGFCEPHRRRDTTTSTDGSVVAVTDDDGLVVATDSVVEEPYPLDTYLIHAPQCWKGWHPRCDNPPATLLDLRSAWMAMEAVVGLDRTARRIGLSNVHPNDLRDLIEWTQDRLRVWERLSPVDRQGRAPPRLPDAVQAFADPIQPAAILRHLCNKHQIEFVSYSTLGTQHRNTNANPVLTSPEVQTLARQHGRSTAEVVLQWARQLGMSVIPRSSKRQHIRELARLLPHTRDVEDHHHYSYFDFELSAKDMARMEALKYSR